jgi:hypothetical protein
VETLNGKRREKGKERCQVGKEEKNEVRVLLKASRLRGGQKKCLDNEWLNITGEPPYKKIIS